MNVAHRRLSSFRLVFVAALVVGCTDSRLQYEAAEEQVIYDNLLRVEGELCTNPADEVTFPVKLLVLIDGSSSLQCTDSTNVRFTALQGLVTDLLPLPNVEIGVVVFASFSRQLDFSRNPTTVMNFILDPGNNNGTATDYQGAIATAVQMIEQDMIQSGAAVRARSRYIVVLVSDGIPSPMCNAGCEDDVINCSNGLDDDNDGLFDGNDPDCANINDNVLHPDNLSGVCNTDPQTRRLAAPDEYVDMLGVCPSYNQTPQLIARIDDLLALKETYSAGDLTLHTVFLFSPEPVVTALCGNFSQLLASDRGRALTLMQALADAGRGTFRDVNVTTVQENFLEFDFKSLESVYWLTEMLAVNEHAVATVNGPIPDTDTDGLSDLEEEAWKTDRLNPDSEGDFYSDLFEARFANAGFDPTDASVPAAACNDTTDFDGDGLINCEENFLGTDPRLADTDGDRVPDGLELKVGTDPLRFDALDDPDFDGVLNRDEIRAGTLPLVSDVDRYRSSAVRYGLDDLGEREILNSTTGELDLRRCYDFSASRIELVVTPLPAQRGLNRIKIFAMQEPVQLVGSRSVIQVACVEVFYQGETQKDPPSGVVDISQPYWDGVRDTFDIQLQSFEAACNTASPVGRSGIIQRMRDCLPKRVDVGGYLWERDELETLLRDYIDGQAVPATFRPERVPAIAPDIFVDIEIFDPALNCLRPWELGRIQLLLKVLEESCRSCAAAQ